MGDRCDVRNARAWVRSVECGARSTDGDVDPRMFSQNKSKNSFSCLGSLGGEDGIGGVRWVREGTKRHSGSRKVCVRQRHGSVARTTCGG